MLSTRDKRVLILGHTGKLGSALSTIFGNDYQVVGANSRNFDASSEADVRKLIDSVRPEIVLNAVAYLGIDPCEEHPADAVKLNAMFPGVLAKLSNQYDFLLVHFSTDAVFPDKEEGFFVESDNPDPVNLYGLTKLAGEQYVQGIAERFYLIRVPLMFGACTGKSQFVEKMLSALSSSTNDLRIADDIVSSPSFSKDIAKEVRNLIEGVYGFGTYHINNSGRASLYELVVQMSTLLGVSVDRVKAVPHTEFPCIGRKNQYTPLASEKLRPMRSWTVALSEYCGEINSST